MKARWNERAQKDPFFFIESTLWDGDVDAFFALGEERTQLLIDPVLERGGLDTRSSVALEIGCGVGRFARPLARRFRSVIAVDLAEEMVAKARELNPPAAHPNLEFAASDGTSLPAGDAAVHFVFSYEVFQHMPSWDVIDSNLREVARVLRPDGLALLHFRHSENPVLRVPLGRRLYDGLRALKHRASFADPLLTDPSFRGIGGLSSGEITVAMARATLRAREIHDDPTNTSHVFVVADRGR